MRSRILRASTTTCALLLCGVVQAAPTGAAESSAARSRYAQEVAVCKSGRSNQDLATTFADLDVLKARPDISRFLRWIADKPADFHAPTRRADIR